MPKEPVLIEPVLVTDIFATGVLPPEDRGGYVRLVCYADRMAPDGQERVTVARLVFSREDFLAAVKVWTASNEPPAPPLHLVR